MGRPPFRRNRITGQMEKNMGFRIPVRKPLAALCADGGSSG